MYRNIFFKIFDGTTPIQRKYYLMNTILHPTYFPTIAHFVAIAKSSTVTFERHDNFQKQSYRNRMNIYGANGKLSLNVPVSRAKNTDKLKYSETTILSVEDWQKQHWKSIESAYKSSPFFEYYEDEIKPFFFSPQTDLYELNIQIYKKLCECIEIDIPFNFTSEYIKSYEKDEAIDVRFISRAKKEHEVKLEKYTQVFGDRHGFLNNLSILDLLFNEGPNTLSYLEEQEVFW